jgi:putative membrane protein
MGEEQSTMDRPDRKVMTLTIGSVGRGLRGRIALALAGLVTVAGGSRLAWAQERSPDWTYSMHPMSWMWGAWGVGMMVTMLVFWGLVIAGIVLAIRSLARQGEGARSDRALDILRERYARGEINKEEFEARRRDLR